MASSKAKAGVNIESNSLKETKSNASGSAGEASSNIRIYCLDDLETIATVGELQESLNWTVVPSRCELAQYLQAIGETLQ